MTAGHYLNRFLKFRYEEPISGNYNRKTGREPLRDLLEETSTTLSSDVRDKIYAFLNLASDNDQYGITPDYGKPPADLFYDLMIAANNLDQLFTRVFRELGFTRLSSDNVFASMLGINLHLTYADLFASSQPKALDRSALKSSDTYSELKADLVWVLHKERVEARLFPVILIGPILDMNSSPDNWKGIAKQSVELVLAAIDCEDYVSRIRSFVKTQPFTNSYTGLRPKMSLSHSTKKLQSLCTTLFTRKSPHQGPACSRK